MIRILFCCLTVLATTVSFAQTPVNQPKYIRFELENSTGAPVPFIATRGSRTPGSFFGVLRIDSNGTIESVGSLTSIDPNFDGLELLYEVRTGGGDDSLLVTGSIYALNMRDSSVINGYRLNLNQDIARDKAVRLQLDEGIAPRPYSLLISFPENIMSESHFEAPLRLSTTQLLNSRRWSHTSNTRDRIDSSYTFQAGFSTRPEGGRWQRVQYRATVELSPVPVAGVNNMTGKLQFTREYLIDTASYAGDEFTADLRYTSTFERDYAYSSEVVLQFVFPPDTPSVHGFNMLDSLFISPR